MPQNNAWKSGIPSNQPIIAIEKEPGTWMIFGGTYRLKSALDKKFEQDFPVPFSFQYTAYIFTGEQLPESILKYTDFVFPYVGEQVPPTKNGNGGQQGKGMMIWNKRDMNMGNFYTMYYEDPTNVPDFIEPGYWNELVFYTRYPQIYPAIALVGPTGNGKTTAAVNVQKAMGIPYVVIDITEFMTPEDLIGGFTWTQEYGRTWFDGSVTHAFRNGLNIIINEFDAANPRAVMCLQSALQDPGSDGFGRYVTIPGSSEEDRVYPQGACTIIVTMNTYGTGATRSYVGRNAADAATMDRFAFISSGYENEDKILVSRGFKKRTADALIKWAADKRKVIDENALKLNISPRTLMRMAHLIEARDMTLAQAAEQQFLQRIAVEDRELLA